MPVTKKKVAVKTKVSKKATAKSKVTQVVSKTAPKKAATKKVTSPRKTSIKKVTPKKIVPQQAVVKKTTIKKPAVKKTSAKTPVKKVMPKSTAKTQSITKTQKGTIKMRSAPTTTNTTNTKNIAFTPYVEKRNETYMNTKMAAHFKNILGQWKQTLMEEVDRTLTHMKNADNPADLNDRATQEEEFSMELRSKDRERKLIHKIDEALLRLNSNEYGYCDSCGIEIGLRRLEARPTARQCIDCKTLDEIRERQVAG